MIKEDKMTEVKLVKATLEEAMNINNHARNLYVRKTTFPTLDQLEFVSMVSAYRDLCRENVSDLDNQLKHEAQKLGASYVFGVEYRLVGGTTVTHNVIGGMTIAYGDAYKIRPGDSNK